MPPTLSIIKKFAFSQCTAIKSISLPTNLTFIGENAFSGCFCLRYISIPAKTATIENNAFSYCTGLVDIFVDPNNEWYATVKSVLFTKDMKTLLL